MVERPGATREVIQGVKGMSGLLRRLSNETSGNLTLGRSDGRSVRRSVQWSVRRTGYTFECPGVRREEIQSVRGG